MMTDEPPFWKISAVGRGRAADTESKQYQILVPNTSTKHFKGSDIAGTRIMRWLGKKKLQVETTPVFSQLETHLFGVQILPTKNGWKVAHSSTTSKSRKVPCWTALVTSNTSWGWSPFSGFDPLGVGYRVKFDPYVYTYTRMFLWHHLGGQFFAKQQDEKKHLQRSYSHFAIQSEDMFLLETMWACYYHFTS